MLLHSLEQGLRSFGLLLAAVRGAESFALADAAFKTVSILSLGFRV